MINFEQIEKNLDALRILYLASQHFPDLIIDGFC